MRVLVPVITFLVGVMVGVMGLHIVQRRVMDRLERDLIEEKEARRIVEVKLKDARKETEDVRKDLEADLKEALVRLDEKDAEIAHLKAELNGLKRTLKEETAKTSDDKKPEPTDEEKKKMEEWGKNINEAIWNGLVIGEKVSDEVAEKLGINDVEKQIIEEKLKEEADRMEQALLDFLREDAARNIDEFKDKSLTELMKVVFDEKMNEEAMNFYKNMKPEDWMEIMSGKKDLLDMMGRDSLLAKLGHRLWKERKRTLDDLQLNLSDETMKKLNDTYLREDVFIFPPRSPISYYGADFSKMEK